MALWVCGGEAGCGTKYAVGLFRCPRCHNTAFYEDGDPMAKITVHGGASDATLPAVPDTETAAAAPAPNAAAAPEPDTAPHAGPGPQREEGGEGPSLGSSSSASTGTPPSSSEPSSKPSRKPARKTASRSAKDRTESSSAPSTDGPSEAETSPTDSADGDDSA